MGSLERRIRKLEAAIGDGSEGCERCAGTTTVIINGKVDSVTKRGHKFPHAAAVAFAREEEPDNRCPLCGTLRRHRVTIGSYKGP